MEADDPETRPRPRRFIAALVMLFALLAAAGAAWAPPTGDVRDRQLVFGGDADYPPYHFLDDAGEADGFDVALAREVAADLGRVPVFELGDWSNALDRLGRGELDVVPMFWSAERERRYLLTEPILLRHHALFGHYTTPAVETLEQLSGVRVAVQRSGLAWEAMRALDLPGVTLVELDNEPATLDVVARGGADYALAPTGIGYHVLQRSHLPGIVALSPPLLERKYVFGVRPGGEALVVAINDSLGRLRRAGVQNRLYVEWIGQPATSGRGGLRSGAKRVAGPVALLAFALAAALFAWRRSAAHALRATSARERAEAALVARADDPQLMADLRDAIARDALHFALQPKIELRSGRLVGAELLVRWDHPRLGPLAPDDFVPIAEQARTVGEMTVYLIRHGLARCCQWPESGRHLDVSINVSANDLADPELVDAIITTAHGQGPRLMLEITETEVMREPGRVAAALPRLREHGIRISVDDFGAGHSSLVNLRRLAPDELKIDRSFVHALLDSPSDRAIVRATIQLGHELGASVAAEGIEDEATRRWLAEAGCDTGQGFGIARPMTPEQFEAILRQQG